MHLLIITQFFLHHYKKKNWKIKTIDTILQNYRKDIVQVPFQNKKKPIMWCNSEKKKIKWELNKEIE